MKSSALQNKTNLCNQNNIVIFPQNFRIFNVKRGGQFLRYWLKRLRRLTLHWFQNGRQLHLPSLILFTAGFTPQNGVVHWE
jgi:hypothetical protein